MGPDGHGCIRLMICVDNYIGEIWLSDSMHLDTLFNKGAVVAHIPLNGCSVGLHCEAGVRPPVWYSLGLFTQLCLFFVCGIGKATH